MSNSAEFTADVPCKSGRRNLRLFFVLGTDSLSWHQWEGGPLEGEFNISAIHIVDAPRLSQEGKFTLFVGASSDPGAGVLYHFQAYADVRPFVEALQEAVRTRGWHMRQGADVPTEYLLELDPIGEDGLPVLRGTLLLRTNVLWRRRYVRFVASTSVMEWSTPTAVGGRYPPLCVLRTGAKAVQLLGSTGTRSGLLVRIEGFAEGRGPSQVDVNLVSARNLAALLRFMGDHMRTVTPRALRDAVYTTAAGEVMCDVLEWRQPHAKSRWRPGWAALVRATSELPCQFVCYRRLTDAHPQQLLRGFEMRCCAPSGGGPAGAPLELGRLDHLAVDHGLVLRVWGETRRTILMQSVEDEAIALLVRMPDAVRHEQWMSALTEAKQTSLKQLMATSGGHGMQGDGLAAIDSLSSTAQWHDLQTYVSMMASEANHVNPAAWEMLLHALDGSLQDASRAALVTELTWSFMRLALGEHPVPMCTSTEKDARWRRFTESWCRYVLRFVPVPRPASSSAASSTSAGLASLFGQGAVTVSLGPDSEPPSATTLVLAILLCCKLETALEPHMKAERLKVVERAAKVNDLVAAMHRWAACGTTPIADARTSRAYAHELCVWLTTEGCSGGGGGAALQQVDPEASGGGAGGIGDASFGSPKQIVLTGVRQKRVVKDLAQLRALCDPRYLRRVTQFSDAAANDEDDEASLNRPKMTLAEELERAKGLLRECEHGAKTREWTASSVVISLLPFADSTVELDGLMWSPLTKLSLPTVQAELLFEFTQLGVYDEVRLMRSVAKAAVTVGAKGSATTATAEALLQLCIQGRPALYAQPPAQPAATEAAAGAAAGEAAPATAPADGWAGGNGALVHGFNYGGRDGGVNGPHADDLTGANGEPIATLPRGASMDRTAAALADQRRWIGPTMRHKLYTSEELRRVVIGVWLEALIAVGSAQAPIPDADAEASLHRAFMLICHELSSWRAPGSPPPPPIGRELLFAVRLAVRELSHEERIAHVFEPFLHKALKYEIYNVDWRRPEAELEPIKRTLHGFLRLCLDLEAASLKEVVVVEHTERKSMLAVFHAAVSVLETSHMPSGYRGVSFRELGDAYAEVLISALSSGSERSNPLRINAMWRARLPELIVIREFWTPRMELFCDRAASKPAASALATVQDKGAWPEAVLRWRLWLCRLLAAALDEPRLVLIFLEEIMKPAVEQLPNQSAAEIRTRTEQQPLQLAACTKAILEALVKAGAKEGGAEPAVAQLKLTGLPSSPSKGSGAGGAKAATLPMRGLLTGEGDTADDAGVTPRGALKSAATLPLRNKLPSDSPGVSFATQGSGRLPPPPPRVAEAADPSQIALEGSTEREALGLTIKARLAAAKSVAAPADGRPAQGLVSTSFGAAGDEAEVEALAEHRPAAEDLAELTVGGVFAEESAEYDPLASVREEEDEEEKLPLDASYSKALSWFVSEYLREVLEFNGRVDPTKPVPSGLVQRASAAVLLGGDEAKRRSREHLERVLLGLLVIAVRGEDHLVMAQFAPLVEAGLAFDAYLPSGTPLRAEALSMMMTEGKSIGNSKYQVSQKLRPFFETDDSLLRNPVFWTEQVIVLFGSSPVEGTYRAIAANPTFYYRLLKLCIRVLHSRGINQGKDIARQLEGVLDLFANQKAAMEFFAKLRPPPSTALPPEAGSPPPPESSIFDVVLERSEGIGIEQFRNFDLDLLASIAQSGRGVEERVLLIPNDLSRSRAGAAMTVLFMSYLKNREPNQWPKDFEGAESMAYNLVYMFREDVQEATKHFKAALDPAGSSGGKTLGPDSRGMFTEVLDVALHLYGPTGLVDQVELTTRDFLVHPRELVDVVRGVAQKNEHEQCRLLGEIAAQYMEMNIEMDRMPLTPHHTQALAMLMFSQFYEMRRGRDRPQSEWSERFRAVIMQMKTGEGKSIVIAMLAIFIVKLYKTPAGKPMRVHILENNEGLLNRDFEEYEPFFRRFGMTSSNGIDSSSDVCYTLKRGNNRFFNEHLVQGDLELKDTILIVDEVDDLVVNEDPAVNYIKPDADKTPSYKACFRALAQGGSKPEAVSPQVWKDGKRIRDVAAKKVEGHDYARGGNQWLMLEKQKSGPSRLPKVPMTDDWLEYKNCETYGKDPSKNTSFNTMCTPFMYNKYECIFGLTGSVGGAAERAYIEKTYKAVAFEVPQFLNTCEGVVKQQATNLGVELVPNERSLLDRVFGITLDCYRDVPVLIITRDADELKKVFEDLKKRDELLLRDGELQWLSERDEQGESLQNERYDENGKSLQIEWKSVIANATKRHGTDDESYCRVTVTDYFGGRGHDYKCKDPTAEQKGGMLVIATSIPDEREWIQWKGRTARQDYRGQYKVILSEKDDIFTRDNGKDYLARFRKISDPHAQIESLLKQNDDGIDATLRAYSAKQARGAWLNELCEKYYRKHARKLAEPWPHPQHAESDKQLRDFLSGQLKCLGSGVEIREAAQKTFGIGLGEDADFRTVQWVEDWGYPADFEFGIGAAAKTMAVTFLLDFTQTCKIAAIDAVVKVFEEQLDPGTLIKYTGVGAEAPIIDTTEKTAESEHGMLSKIKASKSTKMKTDTSLYNSMDKAVLELGQGRFKAYSKWLIVLSDTVNIDKVNGNDPAGLISNMTQLDDFNLAFIDTADMPPKWKPQNQYWPTWAANLKKMIGGVKDKGAISVHIEADNLAKIDEAFESVAALMDTGGAAA